MNQIQSKESIIYTSVFIVISSFHVYMTIPSLFIKVYIYTRSWVHVIMMVNHVNLSVVGYIFPVHLLSMVNT